MNMRQAKQEIVSEYSNLVGFKMASDMQIESYLVIGVKLGEITAQQAAAKSLKSYEEKCTRIFEKHES